MNQEQVDKLWDVVVREQKQRTVVASCILALTGSEEGPAKALEQIDKLIGLVREYEDLKAEYEG